MEQIKLGDVVNNEAARKEVINRVYAFAPELVKKGLIYGRESFVRTCLENIYMLSQMGVFWYSEDEARNFEKAVSKFGMDKTVKFIIDTVDRTEGEEKRKIFSAEMTQKYNELSDLIITNGGVSKNAQAFWDSVVAENIDDVIPFINTALDAINIDGEDEYRIISAQVRNIITILGDIYKSTDIYLIEIMKVLIIDNFEVNDDSGEYDHW